MSLDHDTPSSPLPRVMYDTSPRHSLTKQRQERPLGAHPAHETEKTTHVCTYAAHTFEKDTNDVEHQFLAHKITILVFQVGNCSVSVPILLRLRDTKALQTRGLATGFETSLNGYVS